MSDRAVTQRMGERLERAIADLREHDLDALLVTGAVNVRYLTGFTGTSGVAIVAADAAARSGAQPQGRTLRHRFITDFRYATQSREQVCEAFELEVVTDDLFEAAAAALGDGGGRLGREQRDPEGDSTDCLQKSTHTMSQPQSSPSLE